MNKYYVESGPNFQVVVLACNQIHAILKALAAGDDDDTLCLADLFIVNERGFVWDRPEHLTDQPRGAADEVGQFLHGPAAAVECLHLAEVQ